MALVILFSGNLIAGFFVPADPLVHETSKTAFYFVAPSLVFFALYTIITGAFQGSGQTAPVMAANLFRLWLVRLPLAYWLCFMVFSGFCNDRASLGIWIAILASNLAAFFMIFFWYRRNGWRNRPRAIPGMATADAP